MSTPNYPGWQSGEPHEPGNWQQSPPQYGPPAPQYGPPAPQYGSPYGPPVDYAAMPPPVPPAPPKRHGKLIAASAAVIVLAGGGIATYAAMSSSDSPGGAASPRKAVQSLVSDLNNSDLVGVLDDLAPGERASIATPFLNTIDQLKRNGAVRSDANLKKVGGLDVATTNLTFADATITINDHVQIVQLTGGTVHVSADASRLPFTADFLKAVAPNGLPASSHGSSTLDIGKVVRQRGKPIRIAAQKVDGSWYPSLFYTVADNASASAHLSAPSPADRIPADGGASADDAARSFIQALLAGQVDRAIELLSPDELAVVHDYGKLITDRVHYSAAPITLKSIDFTDKSIKGGTRVTLKDLAVVTSDGAETRLAVDGSCLSISASGHEKKFCVTDGVDAIAKLLAGGTPATSAQRAALGDVLTSITQIGLDTSKSGGSWYVNPIRSISDLSSSVLSTLKGHDLIELVTLVEGH